MNGPRPRRALPRPPVRLRSGHDRGGARPGPLGHAARVAAAATAILAIVYVVAVIALDVALQHRLVGQVDTRLADQLADIVRTGRATIPVGPVGPIGTSEGAPTASEVGGDLDGAPVLVWIVAEDGKVLASRPGSPSLPAGSWSRRQPTDASFAGTSFRLHAAPVAGRWVVVGESVGQTDHILGVLEVAEAVMGPVLLGTAFAAALAIGIRAIAPVEQARRRQLEFTADASHELRTPLTVIEAETGLALSGRHDAAAYRAALERVRAEGSRLRRIVEDLLWLARVDATPPRPADEPVDIVPIVHGCAERFQAVAAGRGASVEVVEGAGRAWVVAPPEWIDRLTGVLVDNACRFAGGGGTVRVEAGATGGRVVLAVEDSGPGIDAADRERIFDRFHREVDDSAGHGLGLAIADAVVEATGGRWRVGDASIGGARFEVSWRSR